MNTKINPECTSDSRSRGIMGSDSPAALLDMLAEVASQTLHSEKKHNKSLLASQCKSKTDIIKRKSQEQCFNVAQLLSMPASQLVKQFSIFSSDELKRQYSYTCTLVAGCHQKYTSFASEGRARMSIKAHLAEHLENLKTDKEAYNSFTAKAANYKNIKAVQQSKKNRLQQSKKPQETLNKENKNMILEKSTNFLRNILLNDISFKEFEKHKTIDKTDNLKKLHTVQQEDAGRIDVKVLGDHSYFERLKDEIPNRDEASPLNNNLENTTTNDNIVFMVVETDSVHMKEYSNIDQEFPENAYRQNYNTEHLADTPWANDTCTKNVEITTTTKPKGKAKFIGTSKEEREMALAFMDRIKKKGNPTGNNLECHICNPPRSFTAPTTLVSHYRSHAGIKPYECRICRAVFTRRHSLKYHMLIHQNQTRFTCADCGKKFRHPSHFREHRRRHTGEAPFGCDDCGQRFKTRNTYKRHLKTRHGKVLTTTGELLYLSEEDFQKVQTNRKKKFDFGKDHSLEDIIAPKAIINYQNNDTEQQINPTGDYIINGDTDNINGDWGTDGTIRIVKKCLENYEIYNDSESSKTEDIETEIPVDSREPNANKDQEEGDCNDTAHNDLPLLQGHSYDHIELIKDENGQIIYHNKIEDESEIIYKDVSEPRSYVNIRYNSVSNKAEDIACVAEYQRSGDFLEEVTILETVDQIANEDLSRSEEISADECHMHVLEDSRQLSNYQEVIAGLVKNRTDRPKTHYEKKRRTHQLKQQLYIHTEPLTDVG
ncbi:hypothetical protein KM043_018116 [Ampulex compressa]|nr:hypothetical protein KM043_018116 [Ampulex compressa]